MDSRPYCFQSGHPLGFAVQFKLTPELKQALINARANGDAVSLRFREEPHREAVLSIAGQEHFFSTASQAGPVEVVEVTPKSKGAVSVAMVKQRLTLQRGLDPDVRPRPLAGLTGGLRDDRFKRSAVPLDAGIQPRVTTTTEVVTRTAPPPQPAIAAGASAAAGRMNGNGMAPLPGSSLRQSLGTGPTGAPRSGPGSADVALPGGPPRKPMELPKPRSQKLGGGAAPKFTRKTPTPPPPAPDAATTAGLQEGAGRSGGGNGGSGGGGGGNSPVGHGGNGGSGGGSAGPAPPAAAAAAAAPPLELPRTAVLAARRGDLPLVVAALLREQPLTASSLQSRIDAAYRAAGAKPEAREYLKRVIDNCCTMSANRMHLKPDVLSREGPRLDELVSGTSPTADAPFPYGGAAGSGSAARPASGRQAAGGAGLGLKRAASCSPDPRLSPDQDPSPGGPPGGRSADDAAVSVGTMDEDEDGSQLNQSQQGAGTARGARHGPAAVKRQKTAGGTGASAGMQQQAGRQSGAATAVRAGGGSGGGGSGLQGYDDFDDLADPPVASAAARESSGGRPAGPNSQAMGRAAAVKAHAAAKAGAAAAAAAAAGTLSSGGPRGLPSFANGGSQPLSQPQQQQPQPAAAAARPRPGPVAAGPAAAGPKDVGLRARSTSPTKSHATANGGPAAAAAAAAPAPPAAPAPAPAPSATTRGGSEGVPARTGGAAIAAGGGGGGGGTCSDSRMDTEGRCTTHTTADAAASPECESDGLDPELQAYADVELQEEDKDADLYRSYVEWKPQPHAVVQSHEQYEQYEREYRAKYEVYHRLNQKYNEVVREADAQRAAVDAARCAEERHCCVMALWRLGASKWRLLEVWKQARRNLHADLGDLRERVAEYLARQAAAATG